MPADAGLVPFGEWCHAVSLVELAGRV